MMATQGACRVLVAVATAALFDPQATSVAQTLAIPANVIVGALAKQPDSTFLQEGLLSVPESYPYGPGDRGTNLKLKMLPGENTASVEYWVLYSDDKALLAGAHLASDFSKGKATLTNTSSGDVVASFIFPHSDNPKPNSSYVRPMSFAAGKTVYYKWIKKKGSEEFPSQMVQFSMPEKLTIANFGDSYASGEGAPYTGSKKWDGDEKCHRSGNSGQAKAVKQFKDDHPGTAVAFKNVACSGAGVNEGIIGPQYHKPFLSDGNHATPITSQIDQVRQWMISNDFDTLNIALLSIGINEIGFAGVVTDYFVGVGDLVNAQERRVHISNDVKGLETDYRSVHDAFDRSFAYDHVLVSQYPDLSHDQHRHFNGVSQEVHGACWGLVEMTSDNDEYKLIFDIDTAMNAKIGSVIRTFPKWTHGGSAMDASVLHGLSNCDEPWFNTIGAALATQGDFGGTFHPNRVGHEQFCKPLVLHDLNFLYGKLTKQALVERDEQVNKAAKDIAIAAARKRSQAKTLLAQQTALAQSTHMIESVATAKSIPPDILEKARLSATQVTKLTGGVDNKVGDDEKP